MIIFSLRENDMLLTHGYAAKNAHSSLEPFQFGQREPGAHDVLVKMLYCGVCHSDIHQVRNEGGAQPFRWCRATKLLAK